MLVSSYAIPSRLGTRSLLRRSFFNISSTASANDEQHYILRRKIRGTPQEVYEVVSEVSKYHEFIPYCVESFVNARDEMKRPIEAGLRVGFRQYDEKFICKVECKDISTLVKTVSAESLSHNLFHVLNSKWTIKAHPGRTDYTEVELLLRYQFKSKLYSSVASLFAKSVTELILKAFDRRVYQLKRDNSMSIKNTK
ncbi:coenzyme Q-binding protein COQ10 [Kluyveromyces marxianus]|uniref:Coenzyme Q-binding protein COQ10 n=2 Tax=Kluyveromyces marxianus TaxID=4911 RepID=W0T4D5_KLUMD|nr:coenzyme Q-binding protein COQ10 [Kluyveromyces marxianus DMKU3-1042]QGN13950.1 coenzyme Q-binding protein COQ10 [Kluyveromyces marxianus]BAO37888.1 coenzyme Q-binding protein COQ10 [Kluyveromyces marxianus DMKU3-1042]BAP69448.1 coenzyme Q-binding protein COQ10 [Kluyveromyces marxianus]